MNLTVLYSIELAAIVVSVFVWAGLGWKVAGRRASLALPLAAAGLVAACFDPLAVLIPVLLRTPQPLPITVDLVHGVGGLLAGAAYRAAGHRSRARVLIGVLVVVGLFYVAAAPISRLRVGPHLATLRSAEGDRHPLQSTPYTCAPTCASALLAACGVEATEGEMAWRARTSTRGTDWFRFRRSIIAAAAERGVDLDVEFRTGLTLADLDELPVPSVLSVEVSGLGHVVLYLGRDPDFPDRIRIGDPLVHPIQSMKPARFEAEYLWDGLAATVSRR